MSVPTLIYFSFLPTKQEKQNINFAAKNLFDNDITSKILFNFLINMN